jgi:hypothetical protein
MPALDFPKLASEMSIRRRFGLKRLLSNEVDVEGRDDPGHLVGKRNSSTTRKE